MISRIWKVVVYYLLAVGAIVVAHKVAPTNLAGPGLDFWALGLVMLFNFFQVIGSAVKSFTVGKPFPSIFMVHILGCASIIGLLFLPG